MRWLDSLAMRWLGRRHGWPVRAGRKFFYEPDESPEDVERLWVYDNQWTVTTPMSHGIYISPSAAENVVFRNNEIIVP